MPHLAGYFSSEVYALNDAGVAIGRAFNGFNDRAVRWDATGAITELGHLGLSSEGTTTVTSRTLNSAGTAVGYMFKHDASGNYQGTVPVRWEASGTAAIELESPVTLTGMQFGDARAINDNGVAVGYVQKPPGFPTDEFGTRAARWDGSGTAVTLLGTLGAAPNGEGLSDALAINSSGLIVGTSTKYNDALGFSGFRAVYWDEAIAPVDLNALIDPASGWVLTHAYAVSDTGWIAGDGLFDPDGPGGQGAYGRHFLLQLPPQAEGDFNGDYAIDGADFLAWQRGESPDPLSAGDLAAWRSHFGGLDSSATSRVVPEPTAHALCGILLLGCTRLRRRPGVMVPEPATRSLCALILVLLLRRRRAAGRHIVENGRQTPASTGSASARPQLGGATMTRNRMLSAVISAVLLSAPARANLLTNGSFEAPVGFNQGTQGVMPPAWNPSNGTPDLFSSDGSFGLAPDTFNNFNGVTAQDGLGWVAGWSGLSESFGQQLAAPLSPNAEYMFSGYLIQARRPDLDISGAYDILLNSTNSLAGAVVVATLAPTTNSDDWEFRSKTFTAPANAGELPWLIFRSHTSKPGGTYPGLDNASLSAQAAALPRVGLFDVIAATAAGPPYPAQPIVANVATRLMPIPPPIVPVERLKLSLFDAANPQPPPITPVPNEMTAFAAADAAALDVAFRLVPQPPPILPAESAFDIFFELEAHPDSDLAPVLIPVPPPIVPPNPVNEFDVLFDAFVEGVGMMQHVAHFAVNAGQPLAFDNIIVGPPQSPAFHVTFDLLTTEGEVMTAEDLFSVSVRSALLDADFNADGNVDGEDLAAWTGGFGTASDAEHGQGDADSDGDVDGADFLTWQLELGAIPPAAAWSAAVPEPAAALLLALFLAAFAVR